MVHTTQSMGPEGSWIEVGPPHDEMSARVVQSSQPPKQMAWGDFAAFEDLDGNTYELRPA